MRSGGGPLVVTVEAEDVELDTAGEPTTAFWNFLMPGKDASVTVAAFPFTDVAYITSER
jgi:hypothetical protein